MSESDEIAAESLETLEYLISSNWISGIDNEGQGGYFLFIITKGMKMVRVRISSFVRMN